MYLLSIFGVAIQRLKKWKGRIACSIVRGKPHANPSGSILAKKMRIKLKKYKIRNFLKEYIYSMKI